MHGESLGYTVLIILNFIACIGVVCFVRSLPLPCTEFMKKQVKSQACLRGEEKLKELRLKKTLANKYDKVKDIYIGYGTVSFNTIRPDTIKFFNVES